MALSHSQTSESLESESLESELQDYALLAAALGGGAPSLAAGRGAGALATAATAACDAAAIAAFHAATAAPHAFKTVIGPALKSRLGVAAVAGVHWLGADGVLAGGVFVLAPVSAAAEPALTALARRLSAQLRLRADVRRQRDPLTATDALTGLLNRQNFDAALASEWQRARRARSPIGLLLFELDGLARIAAPGGRASRDAALRQVAACLQDSVSRGGDVVARFCEESFAILLAEVNPARTGAGAVAERCRAAVERLALPNGAGGCLTLSGGAVALVPDAAEPSRLLQRADSALYMAKDRGGNRICAFAARQQEVRQVSSAF